MLPVSTVLRKAAFSAVEPALEAEPPVPATSGLEEVAAHGAHRAQLRRRGLRAGFPQRLGDLRVRLELGQRRAGADAIAVDAARHDRTDVYQRLGVHEPVAEQRHELGAAGERA
jgi:hypothetical protein